MSVEWNDVVTAATVGTASRPVDLSTAPEVIAAVAPPGTDPAGSLLDAAVAFVLARRAGARASTATVPDPAAADPRPVTSPLATELVRTVLVDREADLAALALAAVAASGRRIPDSLVATSLALATRHASLRDATRRASGPVAPWLGRRNAAWAWAATGDTTTAEAFDRTAWDTGDRGARLAQLRALRAADPAAASALLAQDWRGVPPDEREDLLAVLGPRAVPADEPLLEAALDDRRAGVRRLAASLLAALPGSAFRARAVFRATGLLRPERHGLRRVLTVVAPPPFDTAARRDGLAEAAGPPRALGPAAGPAAARVRQVVAAVPADAWHGLTGLDPRRLVGTAVDPYADECLAGWIDAAVRDRDVPLAEAVLDVARDRLPTPERRAELARVLPPPRRRALVVDALAERRLDLAPAVLPAAPTPWDDDVARGVDRWLHRAGQVPPGRDLLAVLPLVGRAAPPTAERAAAVRALADRAPTGAVWPRAARAAADTLDLRRRLHEELR